jgi:hypothetical protein
LLPNGLRQCGLFIGERLVGPDQGTAGPGEDPDFLKMHERLLKKRNYSTAGLIDRPMPPLTCEEVDELKTLIESRNKEHEEWGWKDHRTCLFLDTLRANTTLCFLSCNSKRLYCYR